MNAHKIVIYGYLLLLAFGALSTAFAQNSGSSTKYHFKFSLMALAPDEPGETTDFAIRGVEYQTGKQVRTIRRIPHQLRTAQYVYRGNEPLTFFRTKTDAEGNPKREVLTTVENPEGHDILILVIPKTSDIGEGMRTIVVEDDTSRFPADAMRLMNYTSFNVKVELGGEKRVLAKQSVTTIVLKGKEARMVPFRILGNPWADSKAYADKDIELPLYSTSLSFSGKHRYLCILFSNKTNTIEAVQSPLLIKENPELIRKDDFDPDSSSSPNP